MFTRTEFKPQTIAGKRVATALYEQAKGLRDRGGLCFLATAEEGEETAGEECPHCGGTGWQYLRQVTGGPYEVPPGGKAAVIFHKERWYTVQTSAFRCPSCPADR